VSIALPTQAEIDDAVDAFGKSWGAVDKLLYGLCREHPGHSELPSVSAKLVLIDRVYAAGLERQVVPDSGQQAITKIAAFAVAHAHEIDTLLAALAPLAEPLDAAALATVVSVHGRLTTLLRKIPTRGSAPRSFSAKYLHFHSPVVPIYDSYAAAGLTRRVRWDAHDVPFERPADGDPEYWAFCVRFLRLYGACRKAGLEVSAKRLDALLWNVPGAA
jgi:hypothetical protein